MAMSTRPLRSPTLNILWHSKWSSRLTKKKDSRSLQSGRSSQWERPSIELRKMTEEERKIDILCVRFFRIMKMLKHRNIVSLIEVCREQLVTGGGGRRAKNSHLDARFYLVFEYCDNDLAGLLANPSVSMTDGERKGIMKQILDAIYFLHESGNIMHRDVKTSNILINRSDRRKTWGHFFGTAMKGIDAHFFRFGVVKLADFGLSKALSKVFKVHKVHTNRVVTLWYRPPELLLGTRKYSTEVDLWGVGCIMAELWTRYSIHEPFGVSEANY